MKLNREDTYSLIREFDIFCTKNKIWYCLDDHSLLGAIRHGGFVPWFEKFQVLMTEESYRKLVRLTKFKVIDSSYDAKFKSLKAIYMNDSRVWMQAEIFLEIRIIVPTTIKKISKYRSRMRSFFYSLALKKDNLKHAINDLYQSKNFQGYYIISSRFSSSVYSWIPNMSFKTNLASFGGLLLPIPIEANQLLTTWFGEKYAKCKLPKFYYEFLTPNVTKKVKW